MPRTKKDIIDSISFVLQNAEKVVQDVEVEENFATINHDTVAQNIAAKTINLPVDTVRAVQAEISLFANVLETEKSKKLITQTISDITKPLVEKWLKERMENIVREAVQQEIKKMSRTNRTP